MSNGGWTPAGDSIYHIILILFLVLLFNCSAVVSYFLLEPPHDHNGYFYVTGKVLYLVQRLAFILEKAPLRIYRSVYCASLQSEELTG